MGRCLSNLLALILMCDPFFPTCGKTLRAAIWGV